MDGRNSSRRIRRRWYPTVSSEQTQPADRLRWSVALLDHCLPYPSSPARASKPDVPFRKSSEFPARETPGTEETPTAERCRRPPATYRRRNCLFSIHLGTLE